MFKKGKTFDPPQNPLGKPVKMERFDGLTGDWEK